MLLASGFDPCSEGAGWAIHSSSVDEWTPDTGTLKRDAMKGSDFLNASLRPNKRSLIASKVVVLRDSSSSIFFKRCASSSKWLKWMFDCKVFSVCSSWHPPVLTKMTRNKTQFTWLRSIIGAIFPLIHPFYRHHILLHESVNSFSHVCHRLTCIRNTSKNTLFNKLIK